jgi:hypothetical protein
VRRIACQLLRYNPPPLATLSRVVYALLFWTGQWPRLVPTTWEVFPNAALTALQYLSLTFPPMKAGPTTTASSSSPTSSPCSLPHPRPAARVRGQWLILSVHFYTDWPAKTNVLCFRTAKSLAIWEMLA